MLHYMFWWLLYVMIGAFSLSIIAILASIPNLFPFNIVDRRFYGILSALSAAIGFLTLFSMFIPPILWLCLQCIYYDANLR